MSFGQNINNSVGQIEYISQLMGSSVNVDFSFIIGGAVGGVVLLSIFAIFTIFVLIIIPVMCYHRSKVSKYKKELKYAQQPVHA